MKTSTWRRYRGSSFSHPEKVATLEQLRGPDREWVKRWASELAASVWAIPLRITQTKRCPEGFYLFVNGERIWFKTRRQALQGLEGVLALQRFQILTVREYAARKKGRA